MALQETWVIDPPYLQGFLRFYINTTRAAKYGHLQGGLVTYVANTIAHTARTFGPTIQSTLAVIVSSSSLPTNKRDTNIMIINVYIQPKFKTKLAKEMCNFVETCIREGPTTDLILTGDLNHNLMGSSSDEEVLLQKVTWNIPPQGKPQSCKQTKVGQLILEDLEHLNLRALNGRLPEDNPPVTSYSSTRTSTILDYTFVSLGLFHQIVSFQLGNKGDSDRPQEIELRTVIPTFERCRELQGLNTTINLRRIKFKIAAGSEMLEIAKQHFGGRVGEGAVEKWKNFLSMMEAHETKTKPAKIQRD